MTDRHRSRALTVACAISRPCRGRGCPRNPQQARADELAGAYLRDIFCATSRAIALNSVASTAPSAASERGQRRPRAIDVDDARRQQIAQ